MDLRVRIGSLTFKNPIWIASGVLQTGHEYEDFFSLEKAGAVITKTVTLKARKGNAPPRLVETSSGLINSIGLENKGVDYFKKEYYSYFKGLKTKTIVSLSGFNEYEFSRCVEKLTQDVKIEAIELNLSCPNISHHKTRYELISQSPTLTEEIVRVVRRKTKCVIIAKLTPNVTDISTIAKAAESGGADAVSLVNTYSAMAVDAWSMKPLIGNMVGGLSGPAIKPMALKAVWDVYNNVKIPVIGIGGIMSGLDAAEFMICGASAVQVGTVNLVDPASYERMLEEFKAYLTKKRIKRIKDLVGKLKA